MTIIFDIDGTLTDQWPLERTVLEALVPRGIDLEALRERAGGNLCNMYRVAARQDISKKAFRKLYVDTFARLRERGVLPAMTAYASVGFIRANANRYNFVYATGGLAIEADYVLRNLGLEKIFDMASSISRDRYRYTKASGLPFKRLRRTFSGRMIVVTDSTADIGGANKASVPGLLIKPNEQISIEQLEACINLYNGGQS